MAEQSSSNEEDEGHVKTREIENRTTKKRKDFKFEPMPNQIFQQKLANPNRKLHYFVNQKLHQKLEKDGKHMNKKQKIGTGTIT